MDSNELRHMVPGSAFCCREHCKSCCQEVTSGFVRLLSKSLPEGWSEAGQRLEGLREAQSLVPHL